MGCRCQQPLKLRAFSLPLVDAVRRNKPHLAATLIHKTGRCWCWSALAVGGDGPPCRPFQRYLGIDTTSDATPMKVGASVRTRVSWYHGTYTCTNGTRVPWYVHTPNTRLPWYSSTYHGTLMVLGYH
jgi:hypothetical protein